MFSQYRTKLIHLIGFLALATCLITTSKTIAAPSSRGCAGQYADLAVFEKIYQELDSAKPLKIATIGAKVLWGKAVAVPPSMIKKPKIQELIKGMIRVMEKKGIALGLAAPQVHVPLRIVVVERWVMINPVFEAVSGSIKKINFEGCASIPILTLPRMRYTKIKVNFLDESGQKQSIIFNDYRAFVAQHEIDHLDGILITDPVFRPLKFRRAKEKAGQHEMTEGSWHSNSRQF